MPQGGDTSSSSSIVVKWGKETVELKLDLTIDGAVKALKLELQEKTGVPVDRQKIMCKTPKNLWKGVLKDDTELNFPTMPSSSSTAAAVVQLLLMGSAADTVMKGPAVKTVFLEDLRDEEIAAIAEPAGLVNLGNTCYLNSVVQCLRAVPQLQTSLTVNYYAPPPPPSNNNNNNRTTGVKAFFTKALSETYQQLNRQTVAVQPVALVQSVKLAFPQFAQTAPSGHPMQQDAEEFYSSVLALLSEQLPGTTTTTTSSSNANNAIDSIFGMQLKETLTCDEFASPEPTATTTDTTTAATAAAEPPVISYDLHRKLVCNIQGGSDGTALQNAVNHVSEGILLGLTGKIEKHSAVLGRDAVWTRQQRIAKLPVVMVIQFGRFYWKATPDSHDHAGVKCKVMKPVAFGDVLDVYDFCTPEIQAVLQKARSAALAEQEAAIERKLLGKDDTTSTTNNDTDIMKDDTNMEGVDDDDDAENLEAALAMSLQEGDDEAAAAATSILGPDLPRNFQGQYELFAVVTHKGRDADGGHYMAWVKSDTQSSSSAPSTAAAAGTAAVAKIAGSDVPNEDWFVFDDDEVSPCKTEDVLKLKGGGDWHMSYLNFYRVKK